jgi:hypothetical protein
MTTYNLSMRDDQSEEDRDIEADNIADAVAQVRGEAEDWCSDGEWGDDGASVTVYWELSDDDGDIADEGTLSVEIEPDHDALIIAASGDPDCAHEWSREGEGGCEENPGVWSTGGTTIVTREHCACCGLIRESVSLGSQRNPGECDRVTYSLPEPDRCRSCGHTDNPDCDAHDC